MELIEIDLPVKHELILTGDWHIGSSLCDEDRIKTVIDYVASGKRRYMCLGGDLLEGIVADDKRFQYSTTKEPYPITQAKYIAKLLKPVRSKILFSLSGNHEMALQKFGNLQRDIICSELDISYGTYSTVMTVNNSGKRAYGLFYTHGAKSISSSADDPLRQQVNMELQLKRRLQNKMSVELCAQGHTHRLLTVSPTKRLYMAPGSPKDHIKQHYTGMDKGSMWIHPDHRWYANTGSMLKLYTIGESGYAERFGYDPTELGCVKVLADSSIESVEKWVL